MPGTASRIVSSLVGDDVEEIGTAWIGKKTPFFFDGDPAAPLGQGEGLLIR